jgi:cobalt-zinc-cadmium efflux system membrane fusion protein
MSSVWILVNIYQNDVAYVHVGDPVTIENESYPGAVHGKIEYISPALDPTRARCRRALRPPTPASA